jgi:hypothetical protein
MKKALSLLVASGLTVASLTMFSTSANAAGYVRSTYGMVKTAIIPSCVKGSGKPSCHR